MLRRSVPTGVAATLLVVIPMIAGGQAVSGTKLHQAASRNDAALASQLLAEGADIEARDNTGATPLLVATHANAITAARALIDAGADVNAKDSIGDSP